MRIEGYIGIFAVIAVVSILYERYNKKFGEDDELREYHLVRKHLLNDNTVLKGKPIIWVHTDYKVNSRKWLDFKSRNTKDLNKFRYTISMLWCRTDCGKRQKHG